jgi:hypothetical protein
MGQGDTGRRGENLFSTVPTRAPTRVNSASSAAQTISPMVAWSDWAARLVDSVLARAVAVEKGTAGLVAASC